MKIIEQIIKILTKTTSSRKYIFRSQFQSKLPLLSRTITLRLMDSKKRSQNTMQHQQHIDDCKIPFPQLAMLLKLQKQIIKFLKLPKRYQYTANPISTNSHTPGFLKKKLNNTHTHTHMHVISFSM